MGFWNPEVEAEEVPATFVELEQQRQAEVTFQDYKDIYQGPSQKYIGGIGDPRGGMMSQDYSGYGTTRSSAEAAQTANQARQNMGPVVASSGSGLGSLTDINSARGAGAAAGGGQAIQQGYAGIVERELGALATGQGLRSDLASITSQAAGNSASRARSTAQHELELRASEAGGNTKLITDLGSSYAMNVQKTGGELNPFEWKNRWNEQNQKVYGTGGAAGP